MALHGRGEALLEASVGAMALRFGGVSWIRIAMTGSIRLANHVRYSNIDVVVNDIDSQSVIPPQNRIAQTVDLETSEQMALAKRLREAREHVGLLQEDVAGALDIPRASVSAIECGKRRVSSLELRRFGRLYRRPVGWLLGETADIDMDAPLHRATSELSERDKEQVLRFAEFLAGARRPGSVRADRTK